VLPPDAVQTPTNVRPVHVGVQNGVLLLGEHTTPQPPQLLTSSVVSMQVPLQSVRLLGQAQLPCTHTFPPWQAFPHEPQLLASFMKSAHAPLHIVNPVTQTHVLPEHVMVPVQVVEQPPQ
jgi:hypothetical protein